MNGILLIDKPSGWTSFDVVAKVRGYLKQAGINKPKVGHTGTLDPLATGLMVLVVGDYTKRAQEFSKLDKTYEVTMKLGQVSTTGDAEGTITDFTRSHLVKGGEGGMVAKKPSLGDVEAVLDVFIGEIEQTPPKFSAIKVGGQRAYKLARQGKEVKLEPRKVTIYEITDVKYEYPAVSFTAKVSSGTYIRSLVVDIGAELGTGAYMTALRRTEVDRFMLEDAVELAGFSADMMQKCLQTLP